MLSKLDPNQGYHQLLLHPDSRHITTFSTHIGLFRYKRLSFGINAATEKFQDVIASAISDIPNVKNISDDVIIYGVNVQEQDKALHAVWGRFQELNLTLHKNRCLELNFLECCSVVKECQLILPRQKQSNKLMHQPR